ncbi:MAG: ATP synthase F0 subunit B [Candidatus Hydrogenedentes bacterium]|nr:ATP synthase F0 subunit B [Candidatus Hydrogenedentota bacterium]
MVDINFTLVVQLLLFLGFLWVMDRWVLRPLLKTMDMREHTVNDDKEQAQEAQDVAESLEQEYAASLASAHQKAHKKTAESLREVQDDHVAHRSTLREKQEKEVALTREEAQTLVEQQRSDFPDLSKTIARDMMRQLGLGGDVS